MRIARSSYYEAPQRRQDDATPVEVISRIYDECEAYRWRRVGAALQQQGVVVNHQKNPPADEGAWTAAQDVATLHRHHGQRP